MVEHFLENMNKLLNVRETTEFMVLPREDDLCLSVRLRVVGFYRQAQAAIQAMPYMNTI